MRFHALLPVRDEADIIEQCLQHVLAWADAIYVFDTGSVDDTWEIVNDAAGSDGRIKPLKKDPVFFSETRLRGWMFHQARQHMREGDWFLRVDADEFHHVAPTDFVRTRLRPHETIVYHQYHNFCLLQSEVQAWEEGRETLADRRRPIAERRHWYQVSEYSEPRLCRYRRTMQWPPTVSFPFNAGFLARARLPIRHYPHRDPAQLERRCRLRAAMMADKENRQNWTQPELHHWAQSEWRKFVTPDETPGLEHWAPGEVLREVALLNHLAPRHIRIAQRVAHQFLLPLLDRMREGWPEDAYPQQIPAPITALLQEILGPEAQSMSVAAPLETLCINGEPSSRRRAVVPELNPLPATSAPPRFFCLLPVRDEADILRQSLAHLLTWADEIHVFDTGSVDESWDIVHDFAAKDSRVKPLIKSPVYFSQSRVRGWLFHQARERMRDGDWFLRVDADEFYHIAPPEFVRTRLRPHETIVYHQYYDFCLLQSEVDAWNAGNESLADREKPIEQRRRWFIPSVYSEPRMCRYRSTMQWPPNVSFPYNAGFVARERMPIRHYPHRDPVQLERRWRVRLAMMADGSRARDHHWAQADWHKLVTPDDQPDLRHWSPGTDLPEFHFMQHLTRAHIRAVQRLTHAWLLPVLDRLRPRWPESEFPQQIPADVVDHLEVTLKP
jgi:glycosyltransferase involved in cell wall biosynthesis